MVIQDKSDLFDNKEWTETNVVPFERPVSKPDGTEPPRKDWLRGLKPGTIFATRNRMGRVSVILEEWRVIVHTRRTTLLYTDLNVEGYLRVDTRIFSDIMELVELLETVNE